MKLIVDHLKKDFSDFSFEATFQADEGSFITILGPSGSGKTTSLQLISGLIEPDSGTILLDSSDFTKLPPWEREIGFVFQDYALFPHMSVADNIAYGVRLRNKHTGKRPGVTGIDMEDRVRKMLEMVGLEGYEHRMPSTLSGGERQRVAVARALAPDPKLLLFDEPLSALDAPLRSRLREEIRTLQQKLGITTIYVTHDRDEALSMSDVIVVMKDGGVVESGTPRKLYRSPETLFTAQFLGEGSLIDLDGKSSFFRPENAQVEESPGSGRFSGTLLSLRYYGGWAIARILPEKGDEITVRIPESSIDQLETRIGGKLGFDIPDELLLTFGSTTA